MPSSLHNTISSCISWCSRRLCWVTMIFQWLLLSPCGYVHHGRHDGFSNNTAWGLDGLVHSAVVTAFGLYAPEISPDSLNLFTILWTVNGERLKLFAILHWETLSLNRQTIISQNFAQMMHPCLQRRSFWWMLLLYSILHNLTCQQLNC